MRLLSAQNAAEDFARNAHRFMQSLSALSVRSQKRSVSSRISKKHAFFFVALAVVFLIVIVTSYTPEVPPIHVLVSALFLACIPFGWYKLTEFTPRGFLILPVIGWLFYFFVKAVVSACIGPLALFFRSASSSCLRGLPWKKAGSNACDHRKGRGAAPPFLMR